MKRSQPLGFWITSMRWKLGHSPAAWAASPHRPQPTQPLSTVVTGSVRSGSGESLMVSEGQPDRRMQARSPVHTSSSMPKRVRTTRSPAASFCAAMGRSRRVRSSMHSPSAMMTLRPFSGAVMARRRASATLATS